MDDTKRAFMNGIFLGFFGLMFATVIVLSIWKIGHIAGVTEGCATHAREGFCLP